MKKVWVVFDRKLHRPAAHVDHYFEGDCANDNAKKEADALNQKAYTMCDDGGSRFIAKQMELWPSADPNAEEINLETMRWGSKV